MNSSGGTPLSSRGRRRDHGWSQVGLSHVRGSFPRFPHFFLLGRRGVCARAHPRPPAHPHGTSPCDARLALPSNRAHAARPPCAVPSTHAGHSRLGCGSFPPRYPASEPFCRGSLPVDAPRRLAGRPATSRGETELTDVSPHPRAPVPLRCVKGGCGRVKFSRPQETRSRAARLSQSSAYSLLSLSLSTRLQAHPRTLILHGIIIPPTIRLRLLQGGKIIAVGGCANPPTLQDARQCRVSS